MQTLDKLSRKYADFLGELAFAYLEENRFDKARKISNRYLKKFPEETSALLLKAMILEQIDQTETAEETYRQVVNLDPNNIRAITRLAYLERGKPDAGEHWRKRLFLVDALSPLLKKADIERFAQEIPLHSVEEMSLGKMAGEGEEVSEIIVQDEAQPEAAAFAQEPTPDSMDKPVMEEPSTEPPETMLPEKSATPEEIPPPPEPSGEGLKTIGEVIEEVEQEKLASIKHLRPEDKIEFKESETAVTPAPPRDLEEMQKIYREIAEHDGEIKTFVAPAEEMDIATPTMAEIFARQGDFARARKIYLSLPDTERAIHSSRIQELEKRIADKNL